LDVALLLGEAVVLVGLSQVGPRPRQQVAAQAPERRLDLRIAGGVLEVAPGGDRLVDVAAALHDRLLGLLVRPPRVDGVGQTTGTGLGLRLLGFLLKLLLDAGEVVLRVVGGVRAGLLERLLGQVGTL
jgi:hypothetical protein